MLVKDSEKENKETVTNCNDLKLKFFEGGVNYELRKILY